MKVQVYESSPAHTNPPEAVLRIIKTHEYKQYKP